MFIFYLPFLNSIAKKLFLGTKNIGRAPAPLHLLSYAYGLQKHMLLTDQNTAEQSRTENNST